MTKVLHHNDNDGRCAAALVNAYIEGMSHDDFIEVDYNADLDKIIDSIQENEQVWIVDFSLRPVEMMTKLLERTKDVIWIDHHKSAIEMYDGYEKLDQIKGIRSVEKAGCELTAEYIAEDSGGKMFAETPEFVKLVGDHDTWQFKYGIRTEHFYFGVIVYGAGLWELWPTLLNTSLTTQAVVDAGHHVHTYQQNHNKKLAKRGVYPIQFEGLNGIAMNTVQLGSKQFEVIEAAKDADIMVAYFWNGIQWRAGVYSTKDHVDCSAICRKYGGGGHKGAAGFFTDKLPPELMHSAGETSEI